MKHNEAGPGYVHFHGDLDDEFFQQLTAEKLMTRYVKGFPVREWVKKAGARNEALDTAVYAYAAMQSLYMRYARKSIWNQFERALQLKPEKSNDAVVQLQKPAPMSKINKKSNFITSW